MPKAKNTIEIKRWVTLPNGRRKRRSFYGASLEEAEASWRRDERPALGTDLKPGTFSWWIVVKWYPLHAGNKATTIERYAGAVALLEPHIGGKRIEEVDAPLLAATLGRIAAQRTQRGVPIALSTLKVCRRIAVEVNQIAHESGVGQRMNARRVKLRPEVVKTIAPYSPVQMRRLLRAAEGSSAHAAVLLCAFLGLSINEARGTIGTDLRDGEDGPALHVKHMPEEGGGRTTDMKTGYRPRELPLPPEMAKTLRTFGTGWLCRTRKGRLLSENHLRTAIYAAERRAGLPRLTPHELRHSFSSWLEDAGCPRAVRLRLMGQSRAKVEDRYNHTVLMREWLARLWEASLAPDEDPTPVRGPKEHGGGPRTPPKGERNGRSKLTAEDVREIKEGIAAGTTNVSLAARYGVSAAVVSKIRHGRLWEGV